MSKSTPWGAAQSQRTIAEGITLYSTASHGGFHLSPERRAAYHQGRRIQSRDGRTTGTLTGATHRCQLEGCTGVRVTVKWPGGQITHPCSKGLTEHGNLLLIE